MTELGVTIYGISMDDVETQKRFAEEHELQYQLLSDPDGSAARKFGVLGRRGFASRVTFILDEKGVIRGVDTGVAVGTHGTDLAQMITDLKG